MPRLEPERLLLLVLAGVLIAAFRAAVVVRASGRSRGAVVPSRCTGLWHVVRVAVFGAVLVECVLSRAAVRLPLIAAGLCVACGAIWLRRAAFVSLGRFYSVHVEVFEDHALIEEGPYGFIRHPLYVSYISFLIGLALAANAYLSGALIVVVIAPFLAAKVCHEEDELLKRLGGRYREYRKRVPAFIPLRSRRCPPAA